MAGRPPIPPEIARLKGNPRKKRLGRGPPKPARTLSPHAPLEPVPPGAAGAAALGAAPAAAAAHVEAVGGLQIVPPNQAPTLADSAYPEFLTGEREREIFKLIVEEFLPRNLVRITDFNAVGRYATYMAMWIRAKEQLENPETNPAGSNWYKTSSKHGEMLRRHPSFQDMLDLGHELRQAEPQLALTPLARNAIMARFMRGGMPGELNLSGGEADDDEGRGEAAPVPVSALGALARAATPMDKLN